MDEMRGMFGSCSPHNSQCACTGLAILDSLMGTDRNSVSSLDGGLKSTFKNSDVCHFYLLDFCPHDLFPNTKSDLGPCPKKHSDAFKEQFLADPDHDYYARRYEREFMDALQRLVDSVEQRIRKGNERILGPDESRLEQDKQKKVDAFKQEISQLLAQAQEAGEKGNIAEAEALTRKTTEVRCSLDRLNSTSTNYLASLSAQEKSLRVCPVCGAMQSLGDAASRFESHVTGKQHVGYERIRSTLATLRTRHGVGNNKGATKGPGEHTAKGNEEKDIQPQKTNTEKSEEAKEKIEASSTSPSHSEPRLRRTSKSYTAASPKNSNERSISRHMQHRQSGRDRSHEYDRERSKRHESRRSLTSHDRYSPEFSHSRYSRGRKNDDYHYADRYDRHHRHHHHHHHHRDYYPPGRSSNQSYYNYNPEQNHKRRRSHAEVGRDYDDTKHRYTRSLRRSHRRSSDSRDAYPSNESHSKAKRSKSRSLEVEKNVKKASEASH